MFTHLLVPVSRTEEVGRALEVALALVQQAQGQVTLLHVVERIQDTDDEVFRAFYERLERQAARDLEGAGERFRQAEVAFQTRVLCGPRVGTLVRYASEHGVDLIVLQSHPVDPTDPAKGWGTISYKVAILAACPVLLVK